jgi:flagella basal body P-ring formation protein FlgA
MMTRLIAFPFLILLMMLVMACLAMPAAAGTVSLRPAVDVKSGDVRLGDVFDGVDPQIDRVIARAPEPGRKVTYDVLTLIKLAQQYRLDWQPRTQGDKSVITRASTEITQDMIAATLTGILKQKGVNGTISIVFDNRSFELNLPHDQAPDFVLEDVEYVAESKRFKALLVAAPDSANPVTATVTGRALVQLEIPVLAHAVEIGQTIGDRDIILVNVGEDRAGGDVILDPRKIAGMQPRRNLQEGVPIRLRDLMPPRIINKGMIVTMKIETQNMQITSQGRALADGALGDVVRVTNTQSNRIVEAIVEGPGIVRIHTAQKLAAAEPKLVEPRLPETRLPTEEKIQ